MNVVRSHLTRRIASAASNRAGFKTFAPLAVNVGDQIPSIELMEKSPGNKVDIAKEVGDKAMIIGVPAAFSPACSASHIPGYIAHEALKKAGKVFVISVNDAFVMQAWKESLDASGKSGIRFLADPSAAFTKALELDFDGTAVFGGPRSKRYALVIENGKVKEAYVEPDNTGVNVSAAEKVLKTLS